jgi:hypothetical protein
MKRIITAIAMVAGALTALAPASPAAAATPPLHEVFIDQGFGLLPDIDCGTFTIHETLVSERFETITYFNNTGNPVRLFEHFSFKGILTNVSTGKTQPDRADLNNQLDIAAGTFSQSGLNLLYTLPHEGLQLATTGRLVVDVNTGEVLFQAGHADVSFPDLTPICSLLA